MLRTECLCWIITEKSWNNNHYNENRHISTKIKTGVIKQFKMSGKRPKLVIKRDSVVEVKNKHCTVIIVILQTVY